MKTYQTNDRFDRVAFSNMLNRLGIKSEVVSDGVTFDEIALGNLKGYEMPQWLIQNYRFMH